jgi:hypothetical protein
MVLADYLSAPVYTAVSEVFNHSDYVLNLSHLLVFKLESALMQRFFGTPHCRTLNNFFELYDSEGEFRFEDHRASPTRESEPPPQASAGRG